MRWTRAEVLGWLPTVGGIALIIFAAVTVSQPSLSDKATLQPPPRKPDTDRNYVVSLGVIEPQSELIEITAPSSGVVKRVYVKPGDWLDPGDPVFLLDDREALALEGVRAAELEEARARLADALALKDAAKFEVNVAKVNLDDAVARDSLFQNVRNLDAISRDERDRVAYSVLRAKVLLEQAQRRLISASASEDLANASVLRAQNLLLQAKTATDILTIRSPIRSQVLRVNSMPGEPATVGGTPLAVLGDTSTLHLRTEIDEEDIARADFREQARGELRGDAVQSSALQFVRVEPLTSSKRTLAGGSERVDTRVVEVVYALADPPKEVFVGMRMTAFIPALSQPKAVVERSSQ